MVALKRFASGVAALLFLGGCTQLLDLGEEPHLVESAGGTGGSPEMACPQVDPPQTTDGTPMIRLPFGGSCFWIDQLEVTRQHYQEFLDASPADEEREDQGDPHDQGSGSGAPKLASSSW